MEYNAKDRIWEEVNVKQSLRLLVMPQVTTQAHKDLAVRMQRESR